MNREVWKNVVGYEGLYEVSNLGNVRSLNRLNTFIGKNQSTTYLCNQIIFGRTLKFKKNNGYNSVTLYKNHKRKIFSVHRLVAEAFIPNLNNLPIINHINSVRDDNRVENLEWCTYSHNNKEAFRVGFNVKRYGGNNPNARKINQYDLHGNFIKQWESIATVCNELHVSRTCIAECLSGKRKTSKKSLWRYT